MPANSSWRMRYQSNRVAYAIKIRTFCYASITPNHTYWVLFSRYDFRSCLNVPILILTLMLLYILFWVTQRRTYRRPRRSESPAWCRRWWGPCEAFPRSPAAAAVPVPVLLPVFPAPLPAAAVAATASDSSPADSSVCSSCLSSFASPSPRRPTEEQRHLAERRTHLLKHGSYDREEIS